MIRRFLTTVLACATPAVAQAFSLGLPLACEIGETCVIQQYVDNDPGPAKRDFACGSQANDGHKGTDFRVATWAQMRAGVDVMASASGTVRATRDGMQDVPSNAPNAPDIEGRECGNAVVIDHEQGWQTTYCHLKQNSVRVQKGDQINQGDTIGQIGASGSTHFPHIHLTLRKDGIVVDPFLPIPGATCTAAPRDTLWSQVPTLEFGGLLATGFSTGIPKFEAIKDGLPSASTLPSDSPALVVWAFLYATQKGDTLSLTIDGPEGWSFQTSDTFEKPQAQLFRAGGRRQPDGGFPHGTYMATITLMRDGTAIDVTTQTLEMRP